MPYPSSIEYNNAIQHPDTAFTDEELRKARVEETPLGLPLALCGGFALTYPMTTPRRKVAVRCFHHQIPSIEQRYAAIARNVRALNSPYFVNFDYQTTGIRVLGNLFPIVRMDWIEGETLNIFLDKHGGRPKVLENLRANFRSLALFLERSGIAHGDIQNLNVIVVGTELRLIDYDGMYVPGLSSGNGNEIGHRHFQHPDREPSDYGPQMDRFSFIVIDLSLRALIADPALYQRFREGGETIIFKANDYAVPSSSEIFRILQSKSELSEAVRNFAQICQAPIAKVPTLEDFLANRNIPVAASGTLHDQTKAATAPGYISAFHVVEATDFADAVRQVGNRVELVGCIITVKNGIGRRGRGKGRPYCFVNFGNWLGSTVRLTIWSEGLANIKSAPSEQWVGRWVTVTGLMDPPYHGKHYGRPYTNVGIAIVNDGQIQFITEQEARYRLRGNSQPKPKSNRDIIERLGIVPPTSRVTNSPAPPGPPLNTMPVNTPTLAGGRSARSNKDILKGIRSASVGSPHVTAPKSFGSPPTFPIPPTTKPASGRIPGWLWVVAIIVILVILSRLG